jgi:hypothetical protein
MSRTFKVAVNPTIVNKIPRDQPELFESLASGWENISLSISEFADHINHGHPFCPQHKHRRTGRNFVAADFLGVDIDHGTRLDAALQDAFVKQFAAVIYTTPSHTAEHNRFRIVFALNRTITNADEMRAALRGAIRQFGGDVACKDACRPFYGSKGSNPIILGNILPDAELDTLIQMGQHVRISDSDGDPENKKARATVTSQSDRKLDLNQMVRLSDGIEVALNGLPHKTPILCPMHSDFNPSAMVITNKRGDNGVYCARCGESFWPPNQPGWKPPPFDFYHVPKMVRELENQQDADYFNIDDDGKLIGPDGWSVKPQAHTSFSRKFLPTLPLEDGVTFVRSPKGSGKTEWLASVVEECRTKDLSVLLVGHRQTLIQSLADRLGLTCYLYFEAGKQKFRPLEHFYAICVDSIWKLKPHLHKFDVILIDESEQVFGHAATGDTLDGKRRHCYSVLAHYLDVAKSVVVCDADLGPITLEAMLQAVPLDTSYRFYLNDYLPDGPEVQMYYDDFQLLEEMIAAIRNGGRHYVSTNSMHRAKVLKTAIEREFGQSVKIMLVTSEETGDEHVRHFVNNIKTEILKYDVVISSPTLGTGIDITFDDAAQLIDTVFGFFVTRVNTHFDMDQQLARVRHPKAIKVWVMKRYFTFETNPDVIRAELLSCRNLNDLIIGHKRDGTPELDEKYLSIYSVVMSIQRASKNCLRENFIDLRKQNGWTVVHVERDVQKSSMGETMMDVAKGEVEAKRIEAICNAAPITQDEYTELARIGRTQMIGRDDTASMRQYEIASFYREPISAELVAQDDNENYRRKVRLAQVYLTPDDLLIERELDGSSELLVVDEKNLALKKGLLRELLTAAGLANDTHEIIPDVEVTNGSLAEFADAYRNRRQSIEELFGLSVRGDLQKKATMTLNNVLDLIGLRADVKARKVEGKKVYAYSIVQPMLDRLHDIIRRREKSAGKAGPVLSLSGRSGPPSRAAASSTKTKGDKAPAKKGAADRRMIW